MLKKYRIRRITKHECPKQIRDCSPARCCRGELVPRGSRTRYLECQSCGTWWRRNGYEIVKSVQGKRNDLYLDIIAESIIIEHLPDDELTRFHKDILLVLDLSKAQQSREMVATHACCEAYPETNFNN